MKNTIKSGVKRSAVQALYKSGFSRELEPVRYISVSLSLREEEIERFTYYEKLSHGITEAEKS